MSVRLFVHDELIPDDGSFDIIEKFQKKIAKTQAEVYIYPDVHYKKGARVVNGMLIKSKNSIFPACLGVENCGYTVGKVESPLNIEALQESFKRYSVMFKRRESDRYRSKLESLFKEYLQKDFEKKRVFYAFINCNSFEQLWQKAQQLLAVDLLKESGVGLGNLGGGNHFFELHEITESYDEAINVGEKWFIVHSDSISFGNTINLLYSNLSELDYLNLKQRIMNKLYWRMKQFSFYFKNRLIFHDTFQTLKLIYSQNDYRTIQADSKLGQQLLLDHNIASVFGDMNRDCIVREWAECSEIKYSILFSHAHDNVVIDMHNNEKFVFHRNGVQYIGKDLYFVLPGAMGTESYILKNTDNERAFFSANHGVGRVKDKHIAQKCFNEKQTLVDLAEKQIKIYRIGNGNISEQNRRAFKNVSRVIDDMEQFSLGKRAAVMHPFAVLKG